MIRPTVGFQGLRLASSLTLTAQMLFAAKRQRAALP